MWSQFAMWLLSHTWTCCTSQCLTRVFPPALHVCRHITRFRKYRVKVLVIAAAVALCTLCQRWPDPCLMCLQMVSCDWDRLWCRVEHSVSKVIHVILLIWVQKVGVTFEVNRIWALINHSTMDIVISVRSGNHWISCKGQHGIIFDLQYCIAACDDLAC